MMTRKDFDKVGNECIDHLTALNPKGGIKVFVRIAVEFGYKKAVKNLTIQNARNRYYPIWILISFLAGMGTVALIMSTV